MANLIKKVVSDRTGTTWLHPYEGYPCVLVEHEDGEVSLILDDDVYDFIGDFYINLLDDRI